VSLFVKQVNLTNV